MIVANLVHITPSQGRDARLDQKFHCELDEGVLNLLADARTVEIVGRVSPSQAQTALGAGMKGSAIMWNTLNPRGQSSPQRLLDPGIRETDCQRAAVLDCYEELLTWPTLEPDLQRPRLIVGLANDNWARGTPIPAAHDLITTRSPLGNSARSVPVVTDSHSTTDSTPTTLVYALAEEVAPESIEMSAHLKPRRCTGGSGFRGR